MAEVVAFHRTASPDDGFYRVANQLGLALCRVHLSNRESRLVHAVMMKTYGFNKSMDWICNAQLCELTGIDAKNISRVKKALVARQILLVDGNKLGLNPVTDEWQYAPPPPIENRQKPTKKPSTLTAIKTVNPDGADRQPRRRQPSKRDISTVSPDDHNRQDTITIDRFTKDSAREPRAKRATSPPDTFDVSTALFDWAKQNAIEVDLSQETERFLDYHRAKGSTFRDWTAAWRNWMRNAKRFAKPQQRPAKDAPFTGLFSKEIQEWIDAPDASPISDARREALMSGVIEHEPF
ncbi:replication protein [Grimontia sp. SpTr1]|uniref:replication protein n=1 Tax=Grimontia sp. SpTr1 TaxID=2995319 RepID=UPI00248AEA26|nr:replication protein [Grimontia sp. SpTr1]